MASSLRTGRGACGGQLVRGRRDSVHAALAAVTRAYYQLSRSDKSTYLAWAAPSSAAPRARPASARARYASAPGRSARQRSTTASIQLPGQPSHEIISSISIGFIDYRHTSCESSDMLVTRRQLTARRYVDLGRTESALCRIAIGQAARPGAARKPRAGDTGSQWILGAAAAGEIFAAGPSEPGNDLALWGSTTEARPAGGRLRPTATASGPAPAAARVPPPRPRRHSR